MTHVIRTVEPLLRGHPYERPTPLERPLDTVNLNIDVLISTPDERDPPARPLFWSKGVASHSGFSCIVFAILSRPPPSPYVS